MSLRLVFRHYRQLAILVLPILLVAKSIGLQSHAGDRILQSAPGPERGRVMRYKLFGRSGLRVSELCLGTAGFGLHKPKEANGAESSGTPGGARHIMQTFAEAGGNFIDTADVYSDGESERIVGDFLRSDRDHFVISTKYTQSMGTDLSKAGNSRKNMRRSVEASLRRLGIECIDIFWLHSWDFTTPMDEIMRGFDDLVSAGKVNYIGASNVEAWRVSSANMLADLRGWAPFIGVQIAYSLLERTPERDLLPMAQELDLGITAYSPLGGGLLTGKYAGAASKTATGRWAGKDISEHQRFIVDQVVAVATEMECSPGHVGLAWLCQQTQFKNAVIPVIGARNADQIDNNLQCLNLRLSAPHLEMLSKASAVDLGYLHNFLTARGFTARDLSFAGQFDAVDNHRA